MKRSLTVIRWIGVAAFFLMAIFAFSQGGIIGGLLLLLGGLLIAPFDFIKKIREKLNLNKTITIVLAIALLFGGVLTAPVSNTETSASGNNSNTEITQSASENSEEKSSASEKTTENSSSSASGEESSSEKQQENSSSAETASEKESEAPTDNAPQSAPVSQENNQIVYTTATGKKYHFSKSCSGLSKAKAIYESTLEDAKASGLSRCSICG